MLSTLFVFDVYNLQINIDTFYTFGSPRGGNIYFSKYFTNINNKIENSYRITHNRDIVPHLPPNALGFIHINQDEIYYNKNNTKYNKCIDVESSDCADSNYYNFSIEDHLTYFNQKIINNYLKCK